MSEVNKERIEELRAQREAVLAEYRERGRQDGIAFVENWGEYRDIRDIVASNNWEECVYRSPDWYFRVEEQLDPTVDSEAYYSGFREGVIEAWRQVEPEIVRARPIRAGDVIFVPADEPTRPCGTSGAVEGSTAPPEGKR